MIYSDIDAMDLVGPDPVKPKNPYASAGKIQNARDRRAAAARRTIWQKKAPDEKGYCWSMGYNHVSGRYTQGNIFPELSGSSLNRKKNEVGSNIPTDPERIVDVAIAAAIKAYRRAEVRYLVRDGRRHSTQAIVAEICALVAEGNALAARELAVWFSSAVRACKGGVSYGVHMLSTRSRGKIKDKATAFFRSCPGDRVFATFSFIASVDDQTGIAILNKFLTSCRKKFPGLQYFWVAERQTGERNEKRGVYKSATGNIHFHMILNKRLSIGRWNAMWVLQQYNAGLVAKDKWGRVLTKEWVVSQYWADVKEGFKNKRIQGMLNPLNIKKVNSIGKLSGYLTKYITKQEKNQPFGCATWHCSRRVSRLFIRQVVPPSAFAYMKSFANLSVDKTTGEVKAFPKEWQAPGGFAVVVYSLDKSAPLRYLRRLEQVNKWVLQGFEITVVPTLDDGQYMKHYICKN